MAVVINGSGTVTGLAVGGLPDGTVDEGTLATDSVTAAKIPASLENTFVSGRKNLIINGGMDVWQRGTSGTSASWAYNAADRWKTTLRDGAGTISQHTLNDDLQPFIYALKVAVTTQASTAPVIQQYVEDSRKFKNQMMTYSFYAKASKAITVSTKFDLIWANSDNNTTSENHSITTSWQRFTYSINTGNPSGSYNTADHLLPRIELPTSDTYDLYITGCQLEYGSTATDFEHRSYGEELALCQRYYFKSDLIYFTGFSDGNTSTRCSVNGQHPVTMRADPTVTYSTQSLSGSPLTGTAKTGGFYYVFNGNANRGGISDLNSYVADAELQEKQMVITNAKYIKDIVTDSNNFVQVTIDEVEMSVPLDTANRHYAEILKQVADGTITIAEAD